MYFNQAIEFEPRPSRDVSKRSNPHPPCRVIHRVIENPDPPAPCFSPVPESIATARDVGFDDMDNGWADPAGDRPKSRNAWGGDDGPKVPPVIVEEAEDGW